MIIYIPHLRTRYGPPPYMPLRAINLLSWRSTVSSTPTSRPFTRSIATGPATSASDLNIENMIWRSNGARSSQTLSVPPPRRPALRMLNVVQLRLFQVKRRRTIRWLSQLCVGKRVWVVEKDCIRAGREGEARFQEPRGYIGGSTLAVGSW